jgi:hypothetical protein
LHLIGSGTFGLLGASAQYEILGLLIIVTKYPDLQATAAANVCTNSPTSLLKYGTQVFQAQVKPFLQ